MDWTLLFIAFSLAFVGAVFFGYPVGLIVGRRQLSRVKTKLAFQPSCRCSVSSDILSAEILEEARR